VSSALRNAATHFCPWEIVTTQLLAVLKFPGWT
jgi:hypothetical protein